MKSTLNPKAASFVPAKLREPPLVVVLIGPPGSGKSTQGRALGQHYGFDHLSVADRLRDMNVKYGPSVASDVLDEGIQIAKRDGKPGIVIEFVRTIDGPLIVEETCRRHGLTVNCVIFFEMDDMAELTARVSSRAATAFGRREDTSPQGVLGRVHEFMFIEEAILQHYGTSPNFHRLDASKPAPQVTLEIFGIIDGFRRVQAGPLVSSTTDDWVEPLEPVNFMSPECRFCSFVKGKTETMRILRRFQTMVGLQLGSTRRFPCSVPNTFDENALQTILASEHKYTVSKRVDGPRYFLLWLRGEAGRTPPQCYLIDENLAVFRTQLSPLIADGKQCAEWGDMLLDGNMVLAKGFGVFITFDALFFDGSPVLAEYLDDRLEHLYDRFPPEGTVEQYLMGPRHALVVLHKNYFTVRDIPRLLREFDIPASQQPYPFDGLIFTPKRQGYKTGPDKNLFEWKPAERLSFEFRVVEDLHQPGSFQLLLGRVHGREFREVIYDAIEPQYQIPPFNNVNALAGSIVECAPRYILGHRFWQILCLRPDRTSPQRETFVTSTLQSCLTSLQLQQLFMAHAGITPDPVQAPPVPYGSPDPPRRGVAPLLSTLSSPSSSMVEDTPPRSTSPTPLQWLAKKAPNAAPLPPEPQPVSLQQLASVLSGRKTGIFVEGQEGPKPATNVPPPLIEAALAPTPIVVAPAVNIQQLQNILHPEAPRLATAPRQPPPQAHHQPARPATAAAKLDRRPDASGSPGRSRPKPPPKLDATLRQTTPQRRGKDDSDEERNPTARRLTYAVDTPNAGAPFGTVTPMRPSGVAAVPRSAATPPSPHFSFSPAAASSPAASAFAGTPSKWGRRVERHDFLPSVKEWLVRKFRVQPSAAKPRPFSVLDACCGGGADVRRWDAAKARFVAGCDISPAAVDEARATLVALSSELQGEFFVSDFFSPGFTTPQNQQFHMVALFGALQYAFASEATLRQALANVAKSLLPGGVFLGTTTDADVILKRVAKAATTEKPRTVTTADYELQLHAEEGEQAVSESNPFGHRYSLTIGGEADQPQYLVLPGTLQKLCEEYKLEYVDYGHLNFHDVGAYLEKSAAKGSIWRAMSPAERDVAELFVTFAFRKEN